MATEICAALEATDARVVLLSSSGDKVFCAGADLAVMSGSGSRGGVGRVVEAMRACPAPVVVRVQGLCLAGGVGLALGADLAIAADTAAFGLPEVTIGLWPFMVSVLLAEHISPKVAMDLMLTGRRMPAAEALAVGLLSRVVPAADLDREVEAVVAGLSAAAPLAVQAGKRSFLARGTMGDMEAALTALSNTEDAAEGIAAFRDKRPPVWRSR
ncbi:enoyl-CoA hydratase-related protein [Acidothermaceae bacterium B102]|nr:enoyl-CoA hydratase-related protein [Acidothermaceae bacterium B102]